MQRWRRASQLISELGCQLQQTRTVKASTTKLPVVLSQDIEGLGPAGKPTRVSHGYARNYLLPKRLVQGSSVVEETRRQREEAQQRKQVDLLIKKLTSSMLTLKRKTQLGSQTLDTEVTAKDIAEAVARQLRIEMVPELLELEASDALRVVGEYRVPLKLVLPGGERAMLDVSVLST
ncbi:hypothetical protein N2152v2_004052 [Parachlorella kessleri]